MLLLYPTDVVHKILCFCEFTFHYASTLSYFEAPCSSSHHNLHSTMLLLYHDFASRLTYRVKIYIPLCFYFIQSGNAHPRICNTYLHSTMLLLYPNNLATSFAFLHHLHSTMLLLYPVQGYGKEQELCIYIPLCFYFIHSIRHRRVRFIPIYIPLCFYFIRR